MDIRFDLEGGGVALHIRATDGTEEALLRSVEWSSKEGVALRFSQSVILEVADEIRKASAQA